MKWRELLLTRAWKLGRWAGLDRAILFAVLARSWSALAGPITLLFVARFLSAEEQGFFYTFSSIVALQVFFELGLAYVIMQSISHEKAHLDWTPAGTLAGDAAAKARLASIFQLAMKWYLVIGILVFSCLALAGFLFFSHNAEAHSSVHWKTPWFLVVLFVGVGLMQAPLYGVMEGCGKVAQITRLSLVQAVTGSLTVWLAMSLNFKLYASSALALCALVNTSFFMLRKERRVLFLDLIKTPIPPENRVSWRRDILPFQWKISLSWLSGYFIFQLTTPVLFHFHGAAEAGRMGMTMRIVDSIAAIGMAWVSTKAAYFGSYIAKRDFGSLDRMFWKACWQSLGVVVLGSVAFMMLYHALRIADVPLVARLLDPPAVWFLLGTALINCFVFNQATYLRAHRQEPFLINSVLGALLVPPILYFSARPYGAFGAAVGLFTGAALIGLPLATIIFFRKRKEWHSPGGSPLPALPPTESALPISQ